MELIMEQISSLSVYVSLILFVVVNLLKGLKKGLAKSLVNLIVTVSSTVVAFLVVKAISPLFAVTVKDFLLEIPEGADIAHLMESSAAVDTFVGVLGNALLLPLVFLVVFLVVHFIFGIIGAIIAIPFPKKKRIAGLAVGIVRGILFFVVLVIPVLCYVSFFETLTDKAPSLKETLVEAVGEENVEQIENTVLDPIQNNVVYMALESNVVHASMHLLTADSYNGTTVDAYTAVTDIGGVVEAAMPLTKEQLDFKNLTSEQLDIVDDVIDAVGASPLLSNVIADVVSAVAGAWSEGNTFLTVAFPIPADETGAMTGIYDTILVIFADSDGETIVADLHTIGAVARVLYENGIIASASNQSQLIEAISAEGILNAMIDELCENNHFRPLVTEVMNLGIWALAQQLGIPADVNEAYSNLMGDMASALEGDEVDIDAVKSELGTLMEDYGAEIPEEFTGYLAEALLEMKDASDAPLTEEDLTRFFEKFADLYGDKMEQANHGGLANLAASDEAYNAILEKLFENLKQVEGGDALLVAFASPETAPISVITAQDLAPNAEQFMQLSSEEMKQEIETITEVISLSMQVIVSMQNADTSDPLALVESLDVESLGQALEKMSGTVMLGDKTGDLLEAVLSSSTIKESGAIGKETIEAMRDSLDSGEGGLTNALTSMQQTVGLVGALGADETDDEKVEEKITWLIENMSPSSANVLKTLITPKMLQKYKIPAENAESISKALGTMLTKMADADAMTAEEYKNEAEAIKYFYHVAIDASKGTGNTIFGGRLPEASVLLDRLMSSKVLSATVVETVYGPNGDEYNEDPMGVSGKISESDRATWGAEIEAYESAHPSADRQTLKALGLIFGYELN